MSYSFINNDEHSLFNVPPQYDEFQKYFDAQLPQNAERSSRPIHPQQVQSTASSFGSVQGLPWHLDRSSLSNSFPISGDSQPSYSTPRTSYASSSSNYVPPIIPSQPALSPPVVPPAEIDYTFLANLDPSLLNANFINPTNSSVPKSVGNGTSFSRKRPLLDEEPELNNTSIDAFSNFKRRKVNDNNYQGLHHVSYPTNTHNNYNNNLIPNPFNDSPALPVASTSRLNTTLSPAPRPISQTFYDASSYSIPVPPVPPVPAYDLSGTQLGTQLQTSSTTLNNNTWWNPDEELYVPPINILSTPSNVVSPAAAYSSGIQFNPNVYPGNEGEIDYNLDPEFSDNLYNAIGTPGSLPSFTAPYNVGSEILDWNAVTLGPDNFCNATSIASVPSGPSFIGPSSGTPSFEAAYHTNAVVNNTARSSVKSQHSAPTSKISTTGNVANAAIPIAQVPSTSGAPSVDTINITYEIPVPLSYPPPSRPKKKRSRRNETDLALDKNIWTYNPKSKRDRYVCRYEGPAECKGFTADTSRNFLRHMRKHAKDEAGMRHLLPHQRVAVNALAKIDQLTVETQCRLSDEDLRRCEYFKTHGRRWGVRTMEREDNMRRKHYQTCHPPDLQE